MNTTRPFERSFLETRIHQNGKQIGIILSTPNTKRFSIMDTMERTCMGLIPGSSARADNPISLKR